MVAVGAFLVALFPGVASAQYVGSDPSKVSASDPCVANGAALTSENPGTGTNSFAVLKNGTQVDTVALGPAGVLTKTYPRGPTEIATFRVIGPGLDYSETTNMARCRGGQGTEVQAASFSRADTLPVTGGDLVGLAAMGQRPFLHLEPVRWGGARPAAKAILRHRGRDHRIASLAAPRGCAAAAVKATSSGPILYRQRRVGRHGRPFTILKLRSMHSDGDRRLGNLTGDATHGPVLKLLRDPRVTPVGRVLRRLSIDELPQLLNVLAGHMSMFGPRPEQPVEVESWPPEAWEGLRVRP